MMNCIPYSPGRGRFTPRIINNQDDDDDDSVEEFLQAHPCIIEREKAQEMESALGDAISMAERDTGSLLTLQRLNKMKAVEMGRRISSLRSMRSMEETPAPQDEYDADLKNYAALASSKSFQSASSLPTFLKVERGNPEILKQNSWATINCSDTEDEEDSLDGNGSATARGIVPNPASPSRTRSWNKLRKTLDKEERDAKRSGGLSSIFRSRKSQPVRKSVVAKDAPVEVSLQSQKNKRGWGRLRRGKNNKTKSTSCSSNNSVGSQEQLASVPVVPLRIPNEISREAEEEDFFVNDSNSAVEQLVQEEEESVMMEEQQQPRDLSMYSQEEEKEEYDYDPMNVSYEESQSMEIFYQERPRMCGVMMGPGFDIIGASQLLKGLETSWRDLNEDNFDIVPRLK